MFGGLLLVIFFVPEYVLCNCTEGSLQLNNSTSPPLLMICVQQQWGYICGRSTQNSPWTVENNGVACQQLGFIREEGNQVPDLSSQISFDLPVHYRLVRCTGVEKRLIDCSHGEARDVSHDNCERNNIFLYGAAFCSTKPVVCAAGMINVVNTTVQICSQGDWHTICGDTNTWTSAQARVACRQLGLSPNGSVAMNDNSISPSLDIVFHCVGSEESLVECSSSTVGECTSGAALTCGEIEVNFQDMISQTQHGILPSATVTLNQDSSPFQFSEITADGGQVLQSCSSDVLSSTSSAIPVWSQHLIWVAGLVFGTITGAAIVLCIWMICVIRIRTSKRKENTSLSEPIKNEFTDKPECADEFEMSSNTAYSSTLMRKMSVDNTYEELNSVEAIYL